MKNFLLDAKFQLKYTAIIVGVAAVISGVLVSALVATSNEVVTQGEQVATQGRRAIEESRKVSDVVRMSMKNDPEYGQNPDLVSSFNSTAAEADKQLEEQQKALFVQQDTIRRQQRTMLLSIAGALAAMVFLIGVMGIYLTHKIAGPIYKMKMLLRQVANGKLSFKGKLRKGDELQDLFETFALMVEALRERQAREVQELEAAMLLARSSGASQESIAKIGTVHEEMKRALDT